jgi:hypothetical protein
MKKARKIHVNFEFLREFKLLGQNKNQPPHQQEPRAMEKIRESLK